MPRPPSPSANRTRSCTVRKYDSYFEWQMNRSYFDVTRVPRPPSEYYAERVYSSFISDLHGVESMSEIGVDNVCFEVDFPHQDSTWPNTLSVAREQLASLSAVDQEKIMFRNAARLFSIPLPIGV